MTDNLAGLATAIFIFIPVALWIILSIHWMIEGDLGVIPGLVGIGVAIAMVPLAIWPPDPVIPGIIFAVVIASAVFFPFALTQANARMHRLLDTQELENAYAAYGQHPDNVAAKFQIARVLHKYGLTTHAVAIAESARHSLSTELDPVSNRSAQDLFQTEINLISRWREEAGGRLEIKPTKCQRCGRPNPPGTIGCLGCGAPYLLDLARETHEREHFITRLVSAWAIIVSVIVLGALAGTKFTGTTMLAAILVLVAFAGIGLSIIFREVKVRA